MATIKEQSYNEADAGGELLAVSYLLQTNGDVGVPGRRSVVRQVHELEAFKIHCLTPHTVHMLMATQDSKDLCQH